jgi:hypothetical protein
MTVDRDQIRRDAERVLQLRDSGLARQCLALLAELEQADARWQEFAHPFDKAEFDAMYDRVTAAEAKLEQAEAILVREFKDEARRYMAEAKLAKVPALVEALNGLVADMETNSERGAPDYAQAALQAWESE